MNDRPNDPIEAYLSTTGDTPPEGTAPMKVEVTLILWEGMPWEVVGAFIESVGHSMRHGSVRGPAAANSELLGMRADRAMKFGVGLMGSAIAVDLKTSLATEEEVAEDNHLIELTVKGLTHDG